MIGQSDKLRVKKISDLVYQASRKIRILGFLNWPLSVRYRFFRSGSQQIPEVEYPQLDSTYAKEHLRAAKKLLGDTPIDDWLKKKIYEVGSGVKMLEGCGTKQFFHQSVKIYGKPREKLRDGKSSPLGLAKYLRAVLSSQNINTGNLISGRNHSSQTIRDKISEKVIKVFGEESPEVVVVDNISAKATASSRRIRIRKGVRFSEKDVDQLMNHEALVHVATTLNGRAQKMVKILGANYGGVTKTQEGIAVFSEFITGCIDVSRMNRVLDRVLAIQMAIDGADFVEVYRFFLSRSKLKTEAYESTRRIFRGGVLTGRYPFTKDIVYLDGLVRVHNFCRTAVARGRNDIIELLFTGKIDLDDLPVILQLKEAGLIKKPKYVPYWVKDMSYLVSYFALSTFVSSMDHERTRGYYDALITD